MIKKIDNFQKILFIITPIAFMSGPFLSNLHVSLFSFFFIILTLIEKKSERINIFFFIFMSFYFYIVFTSLLSENPLFSLQSTLFYFRFIFFSLAIAYSIIKYDYIKKYFFYVSFFSLVFLFIDSLIQYYFKFNIFLMPLSDSLRVSSVFGQELIMGGYVTKLLPLALIGLYSFLPNKASRNLLIFFLIAITLILVLLSGERSALFLFILFIIIFLVYLNKLVSNIILVMIFFIGLLVSFFSSTIYERMFVRTFDQIFNDSRIYIFSVHHQAHYETASKMFIDKPLFGVGPKQFRKICDDEKYKTILYSNNEAYSGCQTHPHNLYLQLLAETGIIGFIYLFSFFIYLSFKTFNALVKSIFMNEKPYNISLVLSFIAVIINIFPFIPSGNFFGSSFNFLFYLCVGFFIGELGKIKYEK